VTFDTTDSVSRAVTTRRVACDSDGLLGHNGGDVGTFDFLGALRIIWRMEKCGLM